MAAPGGYPPPVPEGWHANWSDQYYQWFYIHSTSNTSQWEHPSGPGYAAQPASAPQPPPAYAPYGSAPPQTGGQTAGQGERGVVDKLSNLDPRAQTALAVGGGVVAGALLEHKFEEFTGHHHHHKQQGFEGLLAGAGALGKISGLFGGKQPAGQGQGHGPTHNYTHAPGAMVTNWGAHHQRPTNGHRPGAAPGVGFGPSAVYKPRHSGPPLFIHAAAFADADVTDRVRRLVTPEQTISIECGKFMEEFGDPWPESERKMFNVLYQYGDRPYEVWAGSTNSGTAVITHEPLSNARMAFLNKDPGRIMCLVWGNNSVLSKDRVDRLEREGELDCEGLGNGGFYGWESKSLICYYRPPQGGIAIAHARQGQTLRLPWNPLAKWS